MYGPIKKIIMVNDVDSGKPKGYAFIEYEHERDMHGKSCKSFMKKKRVHIATTEQQKLGRWNLWKVQYTELPEVSRCPTLIPHY